MSARATSFGWPSVLRAILGTICLMPCACSLETPANSTLRAQATLLPVPQHVVSSGEVRALAPEIRCQLSHASLEPLIDVLDYEYRMLARGTVRVADRANANCRLSLDNSLEDQEYRLSVHERIEISGGSYLAVAMGTVTLMQSLDAQGARTVPQLQVHDRPDKMYRGLLVDVAREWHDIDTLEQVIKLCRWYKVNYLQLHLTDNQSFTFPTDALPALPTPGRHYSKQQLKELGEFADAHGVTLVPELDIPGHAAQLTQRMPELFGLEDPRKNPATINMGREAVYGALDRLIEEIAQTFPTSPYIHIGGDEASLDHLPNDPDVRRYLASHSLADVQELYRHFLVRMNALVRRQGKATLVWEGFHKDGEVSIPNDITVMAWETKYQLPQDLLEGGYALINASWKPLYVVNQRKWDPEYIYNWNLYRWENWVDGMPSLVPIQVPPTEQVIGASMESWEQPQHIVLPSLRKRLPAMVERTWNASLSPEHPESTFQSALEQTDLKLRRLMTPVKLSVRGLRFPDSTDGHYNEPYWFADRLTISIDAEREQIVRYTLDGSPPTSTSPEFDDSLVLTDSTAFRARAFAADGKPIGYGVWNVYELHPLDVDVAGNLLLPLSTLWEKVSPSAPFTGALSIRLTSRRGGTIRYSLDGSQPNVSSPEYIEPIWLDRTTRLRAQLFEHERPVGEPWEQHFEKADGLRRMEGSG